MNKIGLPVTNLPSSWCIYTNRERSAQACPHFIVNTNTPGVDGVSSCGKHTKAGITWQDMVPNTEVVDQCGTCGITFYIKRAQLRWSSHLVSKTDDRMPRALFYGQLKTGCRARGSQRKRCNDVLKSTLKSSSIPLTHGKRQQQIALFGVTLVTLVYKTSSGNDYK